MAKQRIAPPEIETELIVSKDDFKRILSEQQKVGEDLYDKNVQTNEQLVQLKNNYNDWIVYVSEYLKHSFNKPQNEYREAFVNEGYNFMGRSGQYANEVEDYKDLIKRRVDNLRNLVKVTDFMRTSLSVTPSPILPFSASRKPAMDEVFIVHGHDEEAKTKTARFIEKLGFKPIILHEQASSGKTIIEKIEEHTNVGFGIVLYTPCDTGGKKVSEPILRDRARQNVVFEHGYLIGRIGRANVCALVKGNVETPNDISGVVYVSMDEAGAWHIAIAKELRSSGYDVDMNKVI